MRRAPQRAVPWGPQGSILLEVMVAVVLIGLVVGPLATSLALGVGQEREWRRAAAVGAPAISEARLTAWTWGPRVTDAWWRPGPVLHVKVSTSSGPADSSLGVWADGWPVTEQVLPTTDAASTSTASTPSVSEVEFPASLWTGWAGGELTLRVRNEDEAWGPPWRLAIPGAAGGAPPVASELLPGAAAPSIVVHRPAVGTSELTASWSAAGLRASPFSSVFVLAPGVQGWGGVTVDGRCQWLYMGEGRDAEVYF